MLDEQGDPHRMHGIQRLRRQGAVPVQFLLRTGAKAYCSALGHADVLLSIALSRLGSTHSGKATSSNQVQDQAKLGAPLC